jgi:endonuclease/exonuclease/phosphatase family metal-dependent hydrolase
MYSEDMSAVAELIRQLNPDVVCLQELTQGHADQWPDTGAYIAERLGYYSHVTYGRMTLPDGQDVRMGNGIFSRFALDDKKAVLAIERDIEAGGVIGDDRYYLQATVLLSEGESEQRVSVGTFHAPFSPTFKTTPLAVRLVSTILEHVQTADEIILMGDLNRTPGTRAARLLRSNGLRNVGPGLNRPTWTTRPFTIGPWSYDKLAWRLDYTLFKGAAKRTRSEIMQTTLSDHLPVLVELEW